MNGDESLLMADVSGHRPRHIPIATGEHRHRRSLAADTYREKPTMSTQRDAPSSNGSQREPEAGALDGKNVLVAGGSGNVGRYIVAGLLEAGARVIIPTRDPRKLEGIRDLHGTEPDGPVAILGDITDEQDGPRVVDRALPGGARLHGAVASLGAFVPTKSVLSASKADLDRAVQGYLMAHHGAARNLVPRLRASGGSYVMIQGPLAFEIWSPEASLVSIATAAQAMLAQAIMKEEDDVRVNEMVLHSAVGWGDADKASPLDPMDIGRYVAHLLSREVHGQTLHLESPEQVREIASGR
jgi:NAD(P)-dependent dehydrogenase (short-subunit alcohol dehydrogenase family)